MITDQTDCARYMADGLPHTHKAPRAAAFCWQTSLGRTVFAVTLMVLAGMLPAVLFAQFPLTTSAQSIDTRLDRDHNGSEDLLDSFLQGKTSWADLQQVAAPPLTDQQSSANQFPHNIKPVEATWSKGQLRIICLKSNPDDALQAAELASVTGVCTLLHNLDVFGGVQVFTLNEPALRTFLANKPDGRIVLDRNGTPALNTSVFQMGGRQAQAGPWKLGNDWSATVAILDSGCDTAHDDLGDFSSDNFDGPPPAVGDVTDWYPGDVQWPSFSGYRVVGWNDVTDDFPEAQGPWDYYYHGTALASVVAGSGRVEADHGGVAPGGRLTVVKFYDFDQVWHTWAGDYLAACAWTLEHRHDYRIRVVLTAVNWAEDLGITDAINDLVAAGLFPVVAMGNYGADQEGPGFPASIPDALTVGSVNNQNAVSAFSGRGIPGEGKPDLMGPGGGLLESMGRIDAADNDPNDSYSGRSGTSLAAAHAAGAAFLLTEALVDNGIVLPEEAQSVRTLRALLSATGGRISHMETPAGEGLQILPAHDAPDEIRGWGSLRVDAAVNAILNPIFPGDEQSDSLTADNYRTVIARRVALSPGVRYMIEAVPEAGLDVDLALIDPRLLDFDPTGSRIARQNSSGVGVSEFVFHDSGDCDWAFLVVRRVSGEGVVALRVVEADGFLEQARMAELPGIVSAAPNYGNIQNSPGISLVIPSRVYLDPSARAVNVYNGWGETIPGWPVFVFPRPSSNGGLTQPLIWNLDGEEGDEIVLASDFGSIYFFNHIGAYEEIELAFNRPLTAPVGLTTETGDRRIAVMDGQGVLRIYSWGPNLEVFRDLNINYPLQPACGSLISGGAERLVVAFAGGLLTVMDSQGQDLPNWPIDLGTELTVPPVLADIDADGDREILLPVFDEGAGTLVLRIFEADGTPVAGDGSVLPTAGSGSWLDISWPLMAGSAFSGDLRLEMAGIFKNDLNGDAARWSMASTGWLARNQTFSREISSFRVSGTTSEGVLRLDQSIMAPPLAWDFQGGPGSEITILGGFRWQEILYGLTSIPGSCLGVFKSDETERPLESIQPLALGGSEHITGTSVASVLVPIDDDLHYQVQIVDSTAHIVPVRTRFQVSSLWPSARADQLNTGSYPVGIDITPVPVQPISAGKISVYPNPGPGCFQFSWNGDSSSGETTVAIFDLRGRLVTSLRSSPTGDNLTWNGRDARGRGAAAGTYMAVARRNGQRSVARFVLTR